MDYKGIIMGEIHSYVIEKNGIKYARVASGELVGLLFLDYKNETLENLGVSALHAFKRGLDSDSEIGKKLRKHCKDGFEMYKGAHHLVIITKKGSHENLFYVTDEALPSE